MKTLVVLLVLLAAGVGWLRQRIEHAELALQVNALREAGRELEALQRERDRLRWLHVAATTPDNSPSSGTAAPVGVPILPAARDTASPDVPTSLAVAHWTPAEAWQDRGRATPEAALETALWAAAGGDVAAFEATLELDAEVRRKAVTLLAQLSETSRARYGTPEKLLAEFTIKNIPIGAAQMVWYNAAGADEAVVGLFLKNPDAAPPATELTRSAGPRITGGGAPPPQLSESRKTQLVYLTLRRRDDGWRLTVPENAVDVIAREVVGAPGK